jgi:hypothetical protein
MASLSEHAELIKAAFEAAEVDGFRVEVEYEWDRCDSSVLDSIRVDVTDYQDGKAVDWECVLMEEM